MAVGVKVTGMDRAQATLRRVERVMGRPEPLLKAFAVDILKWIDRTFEVGGRPRWKALRPLTIAARRQGRGGGSVKPLRSTGAAGLQGSFFFRMGSRSVFVGSDSEIAVFHEFGTRDAGIIKPKTAKALIIPTGPMTFGAVAPGSRFRAGGGLTGVVEPGGRRRQAFKGMMFRKSIKHKGVPIRRMTPTKRQLTPILSKAGNAFFKVLAGRTGA